MKVYRIGAIVGVLMLLGACGVETVVQGLDEKEANQIVVLLADNEITAVKTIKDTGREIFFGIAVPPSDKLKALRVLNVNDHPRRKPPGYAEVFKEGGLIPTAAEEKAKKLSAIEGEIERQLALVDGVLDAEVNVVMPEENALRMEGEPPTPTTASVTIKYMPGENGEKPPKPQIQAIVAAGVEKLKADQVIVAMAAAAGSRGTAAACPPGGTGNGILCRMSGKTQKLVIVGTVICFLLLALGIMLSTMRLRTVRSRLLRLQNEIAKARRKGSAGDLPAPS